MMKSNDLYLGVMSGTSFDGIDIALIECRDTLPTLIEAHTYPMPSEIKYQLHALAESQIISLKALGELDHRLGQMYATHVNVFLSELSYTNDDIAAVGCHGQTVYHAPEGVYPFTLQLGDANIIAVETGITTIADFRRKDMALGGIGAPLVPTFHQAVFQDPTRNRVVLNLGGLANITRLRPDHPIDGYDTGPANVLLDSWAHKQWGETYDNNGQRAAQGQCQTDLLAYLLHDPYFEKKPPKSTGREYFNLCWLEKKLSAFDYPPEDIQATLTALTAESVARDIRCLKAKNESTNELIVCGGGVKNRTLMQELQHRLAEWQVHSSLQYGLDPDFIEAMAFAWLAYLRINNLPGNLPQVTGARRAICLGAIFPGTNKECHYVC